MNYPKLQDLSWGDVISVTAWVATVVYTVAVLRADISVLKTQREDLETRMRVVERVGSDGLKAHISLDDERQRTTETEIQRQRAEIAAMREAIARIDANVVHLLKSAK
jgi:hypothetical protein